MTREQFDALVERIEQRYGLWPVALQWRAALMVALGYAGFLFWFVLVIAVGLLFFLGAVTTNTGVGLLLLLVGACLLTLGVVQACLFLWVLLEPLPGRVLTRDDAPPLFEVLDRLRRSAGSAHFHQVRLTWEFNAGVQQIPRLGVFGWSYDFLYIGLPLLEGLSPSEFEAVLAHEFFHLSARHGRFGAWLYRLRQTWERLFERLRDPATSATGVQLRRFCAKLLDWYWPRFNAYAFVLSRAREYAADRFSAEWAGSDNAASALWRIECLSRRLDEKFWEEMTQRTHSQPEPPTDLMSRLTAFLSGTPDVADATRWMDEAARRLTDNVNTHPSLTDRFRAIGQSPDHWRAADFPEAPQVSAADRWLGDGLPKLREDVSELWRKEIAEAWQARHKRAAALQHRKAALDEVSRDDAVDPEVLWSKAAIVLHLDGPRAAEPLLRQLLNLRPDHSFANLVLGRHLLEQGQPDGERHLRRILDQEDDELIPQACEVLTNHFQSVGLTDRVLEVRQKLSRFEAAAAEANRERNLVSAADRVIPHDLSPEELVALKSLLERQPDLRAAYLVRKELRHFPRRRLFVLCVHTTTNFWGRSRPDPDAALVARLIPLVQLPGRVLIIAPHGGFQALAKKVLSLPESAIISF